MYSPDRRLPKVLRLAPRTLPSSLRNGRIQSRDPCKLSLTMTPTPVASPAAPGCSTTEREQYLCVQRSRCVEYDRSSTHPIDSAISRPRGTRMDPCLERKPSLKSASTGWSLGIQLPSAALPLTRKTTPLTNCAARSERYHSLSSTMVWHDYAGLANFPCDTRPGAMSIACECDLHHQRSYRSAASRTSNCLNGSYEDISPNEFLRSMPPSDPFEGIYWHLFISIHKRRQHITSLS